MSSWRKCGCGEVGTRKRERDEQLEEVRVRLLTSGVTLSEARMAACLWGECPGIPDDWLGRISFEFLTVEIPRLWQRLFYRLTSWGFTVPCVSLPDPPSTVDAGEVWVDSMRSIWDYNLQGFICDFALLGAGFVEIEGLFPGFEGQLLRAEKRRRCLDRTGVG